MEPTLVTMAVERDVATITLDAQHNRNALSQQLVSELNESLEVALSPDVRAIVLTHAGPAFCSGADLKERALGINDSHGFVTVIQRLGEAAQPTIAAVKGAVRAGGIGLMAACDLIVVPPATTFAFTEVRLGVAPAIVAVPILHRCGWSRLAAPFLTGEVFDATAALTMGLVTHVDEDVDAAVARLLEAILAGGPNALAATKRLLREPERSLNEMRVLSEHLFASAEGLEGMRAFAERRPPAWVRTPD